MAELEVRTKLIAHELGIANRTTIRELPDTSL